MLNLSGLLSSVFSALNDVRYWLSQAITNPKTFALIGLIVLFIVFYLISDSITLALWWTILVLFVFLVLWLPFFIIKKRKARKANKELGETLEQQVQKTTDKKTDDLDTLRNSLLEAVRTIKTSKIGQATGKAALYELPWYIVIGNPAAGKSSAITHSGLQFPFADKKGAAIKGVGGTRNCDWFFTTEGILLDTAGRYSVHEEDRNEWLGFLDLLKRHRPKAPINGIIVAASISELTASGPEFAISLAKNLRQRVQELTERLEVFAPVYIFFTKVDLIAGFTDFFGTSDENLRHHPWGATIPYPENNIEDRDIVPLFDSRFDELYQGLKEMSMAQIALRSKTTNLPPGLLTFPLEFTAIKPILATFLATLFENNPYQYKPIFRGFYFTSALQEGAVQSTSAARLSSLFALEPLESKSSHQITSQHGFFLKNLFSKVILTDKHLVRQHSVPGKQKMRYAAFFGMVALLGLLLGGWSWSYLGNQKLIANTQADLDSVVRVQTERVDLESRLEAMEILQRRIEQLDGFDNERPFSLGLGLFQGKRLKQRLLDEYYNGLNQFMIAPVKSSLEDYLSKVELGEGEIVTTSSTELPSETLFQDASPHNIDDAYNALKAYLMMANRQHVEPSHLSDQITRFWRGWLETNRGAMPREKLIESASHLVRFYVSRTNDAQWPEIKTNLALVEKNRTSLRALRQGMPARERVYSTIKTRASTRFQTMTVASIVGENDADLLTGSYAVPGQYTRRAWLEFIEPEFREAAKGELQTTDWVLGVNMQDDLTLEGSPEQIFQSLAGMYKKEYAEEWKKFLRGVSVRPFATFSQAADGMNRLGNPQISPITKLLNTAYEQTSWDNPKLAQALGKTTGKVSGWFRRVVMRQSVPASTSPSSGPQSIGTVGEQFSDIARLLAKHENQSMLDGYMEILSKIRTRFNLIQNEGDPGPGTLKLLRETLEGKDSELSEALQLVDEQILTGLTDDQRLTLRPILVRPLVQAYAAAIPPSETELNKVWLNAVYEPFNQKLVKKYPFDQHASIEASSQEIAEIFGPQGSIANYVNNTLATLTIRRGSILTARTWGDIGINLQPAFTANFANWIAPLTGGAAANTQQPQTVFQIQPKPTPGATEYTIEIDGQQMRYRNTPPQWVNFVWPNPQGNPGVKITAVKYSGETVTIIHEPGRFGLERLIESAQRTSNPDGSFNMVWSGSGVSVPVVLRIISTPDSTPDDKDKRKQGFKSLRLPMSVVGSASKTTTVPGNPAP